MKPHTADEPTDAINELAEVSRHLGAMVYASTIILRAILEREMADKSSRSAGRIAALRRRALQIAEDGMEADPLQAAKTKVALLRLWAAAELTVR